MRKAVTKVPTEYKLQNVLLKDDQRTHDYEKMYVRTHTPLLFQEDGSLLMPAMSHYRFDTYFGGCSTKKWNRYANAKGFKLKLRVRGKLDIRLTNFTNDMEYNIAARSTCGKEQIDTEGEVREIEFSYPDDVTLASDMVAFEITSLSESALYAAWYACDIDEGAIRDVELNIITPTFKKEEFVRANVQLFEDLLESDEPIAEHLTVTIVDNGQTLGDEPISTSERIVKFDNPNFGGAGGFSRGMIEALRAPKKPTHLLVMDDDVSVSPESFVRTYNLLRIVNDEYRDAFLSGAMISLQLQDHQVEDVGNIFDDGTFGAVKSFERDLSDLDHIVSNEACRYNHARQYAAFWYCCFPITVVEEQGLCMPFFVRGDDAEFGLRKAGGRKFMTMNGICVWHMSFGKSKFNVFNECYLAIRNMLVIRAINEQCEDVGIYELFRHEIETELRKFNYDYAELMCDAVEDYLKGPEWLASQNPEGILKEKIAKKPAMEEFKVLPPSVGRIYDSSPLGIKDKLKMKLTHNGHVHCDDSKMSDVPGIMPNEYRLYQPDRIFMRKEIWMINDDLSTGYRTRIDRDRYSEITRRIDAIDKEMAERDGEVRKAWKEAHAHLVSPGFWEAFLGLGDGEDGCGSTGSGDEDGKGARGSDFMPPEPEPFCCDGSEKIRKHRKQGQ